MGQKILEAARNVKGNIVLVALLSFTGIWVITDSNYRSILSPINFLLFVFIEPIIYGRCIDSIKGIQHRPTSQLLNDHLLNYWIVSAILIATVIIAGTFINKTTDPIDKRMIGLGIGAVVNTLAIYIFPLVFIENISFSALPVGLKYLLFNLKQSLPLMFLIIAIFLIKITAYRTVYFFHTPQKNILLIILIAYICNFLGECISLIVFNLASFNIVEQSVKS